jgi:hypothetical protein
VAPLLKVLQEALVKPVLRGDGVVALLVAAQLAAADTTAGGYGALRGLLVRRCGVLSLLTIPLPSLQTPNSLLVKAGHALWRFMVAGQLICAFLPCQYHADPTLP